MSDLLTLLNSLFGEPVSFIDFSMQSQHGLLSVNVIRAVKDSDLIGHICYIVLAVFSILSWAVIGFKLLHIYHATKQTDQFVDLCMSGGGSLDEAYKYASDYPDSPLAQILRETYLELQVENWYRSGRQLDFSNRLELAKVGIERILQRTSANEVRHLESYLIFLATTAAVCPFIGLFGTVWGVLGGFQLLAIQGAAAIQALAGPISTALGTTVAGLVAAIPAVVSYNYLSNKIQILVTRMESFGLELSNVIQKRILQQGP